LIAEVGPGARAPLYLTAVRDLYALDLPDGGRVEVRRHGAPLTALVYTSPGGEPAEFDLRRWHYRQWSTQIEDRDYSEGLRGLIAQHGVFEHPQWITGDRPDALDAESLVVIDDLRSTWRARYGSFKATGTGGQLCSLCLAAEPPRGPLTAWSAAPNQQPCPHRDAAARAIVALAHHYEELVFELLDLLVVAHSPGSSSAPTLRRFVLPSDWMRALLGHWLLGPSYVHNDHAWRARGAPRHRRFSHRALRAEGHGELTAEERYSALAWGISPDDLSLMPEEPEASEVPEASWWVDSVGPVPAGVRVYPEGITAKPRGPAAPSPGVRAKPIPRIPLVARLTAAPLLAPSPAAAVPRKSQPVPAPKPAPKLAPTPAPKLAPKLTPKARRASAAKASAGLEETLSSLTAGLAALSQIMGGPKSGRR
jgi:hypothetical protein